jgi:hypothetical protein
MTTPVQSSHTGHGKRLNTVKKQRQGKRLQPLNGPFGLEKVLADLKKIGVEIVFLSSGAVCRFPPCPHIAYLRDLAERAFDMKMVVGTHPIPTTFWEWHKAAGSWDSAEWQEYIKPTTTDEKIREAYINIV